MAGNNHADVIVVGSGNAAFSAALSAREHGAHVLMLEKGSSQWIGGNSWFTAGAFRLTHDGIADVAKLVETLPYGVELPAYTVADYHADMRRVTDDRCDPVLTTILVNEAREAAEWMRRQGVQWRLMTDRQAHQADGHIRFWGGLSLGTVGGGAGMIDAYLAAARRSGVEIRTHSAVEDFVMRDGSVVGVRVRTELGSQDLSAGAIVLASGGFEASSDLRAQHLGPAWEIARVRGTPHNTGEAMMAAVARGAQAYGDWAGCHAIAWDAAAPPHGDRHVSNRYSRQAYPFGLLVNVRGQRFLDEGADFRNYTYAKYGAEILRQPSGLAFQIFDAKTISLTSPIDYATAEHSRYEGRSIRELAERTGIDRAGLEETIRSYNAGVMRAPFDPAKLDGKGTRGVQPPKSNWAQPIDRPPYVAFAVVCGITFTFGGLKIDKAGGVQDRDGSPLVGLYAAGETVGGLFHGNYPGGTGLASGTVFGRRAGRNAAMHAASVESQRPV